MRVISKKGAPLVLLILTILFLAVSCGKADNSDTAATADPTDDITLGESTESEISTITLSSVNGNTVIDPNSSLSIYIELITGSGQPLPGEATVHFQLDDPTMGSISSPVTVSDGTQTVTFSANNKTGIVRITADVEDIEGSLDIQISDVLPPAAIQINADPNAISVRGTSHITVMVSDTNGQPVTDWTQVNFSLNNDSYGTMIPESDLTDNGEVYSTFKALTDSGEVFSGEVTITASSGSITNSVTVTIAKAEAGSIEFVSALPQAIGLKGSGQNEVSTVTFLVKDGNGDPIQEAQSMEIILYGPGGGEYIEEDDVDPNKVTVSTDENGEATVDVHSGVIPGTVTLKATLQGTNLSTSTGVISIGGGVPSESHFSLSASIFNLAGVAYDGLESEIMVRLADRYGNVEVLEGTTVSFYSESGGISLGPVLDATGYGSVTFRTQDAIPHKTIPDPNLPNPNASEEVAFLQRLIATFPNDIPNDIATTTDPSRPNPRDGLCTIVAIVDGEEEFTDRNANGEWDPNEKFDDTYDDIFIDKDDDNIINTDFEDLVIDRDENGFFDGYNNSYDSHKKIGKYINLLITGQPRIYTNFPKYPNNYIPDGSFKTFEVFVGDCNFNPLIAGTQYSIETDGGKLSGVEEYTFADTSSATGGPIFSYCLYDADPADSDPNTPDMVEVKMSVTWGPAEETLTISETHVMHID